jgi:hypothetical protein
MGQGAYRRSVSPVTGIDECISVLIAMADIGLDAAK